MSPGLEYGYSGLSGNGLGGAGGELCHNAGHFKVLYSGLRDGYRVGDGPLWKGWLCYQGSSMEYSPIKLVYAQLILVSTIYACSANAITYSSTVRSQYSHGMRNCDSDDGEPWIEDPARGMFPTFGGLAIRLLERGSVTSWYPRRFLSVPLEGSSRRCYQLCAPNLRVSCQIDVMVDGPGLANLC